MNVKESLNELPDAKGAVVVLSGGMDSTIAARLAVEKYGAENVHALTFFYQQKQALEIDYAVANANKLNLAKHTKIDIGFLGDMVRGVSANIVGGKPMPSIKEILGDPAPATEVPFRNAILLMISTAYAQANNLQVVVTGIQEQDQYSYFDTTPEFIDSINNVLSKNRMHSIRVTAPWLGQNKATELKILHELDGNLDLMRSTLTCYNPDENGVSCGRCPSCSERIHNFVKAGFEDPIPYAISIPWKKLLEAK